MPHRLCVALSLLSITLIGCGGNTGPAVVPKKAVEKPDDKIPLALDIFRQGGDIGTYREALNLLSVGLHRRDASDRPELTADDREFLSANLKLTPTELDELASYQFRPIDAAHVEASALFRDAARTVEVTGLTALEQAAFAFDWVARRVMLHEQRQDGLPPAFVLRAGYGGPTDRGLVFLALVHQLNMEGCLLAPPGADQAPLVGVLIDKSLRLFDTRLGLPVPGPDGANIASLDDVLKNPDLLKHSKLDPKLLEVRVAVPLESLAPRMLFLQSLLRGDEAHVGGDRLAVHHDVAKLARDLKAAGANTVVFWQPALRSARLFASPDDGGLDTTQRARRFAYNLVPWNPVLQRYQELKILGELPPAAREALLTLTADLFEKYYRQPGEMLARGQTEALPRRLERIRVAVEDAEFASVQDEANLVPIAAKWRERVNQAYLAAVRQELDGQAKVKLLWEEDHYLLFLLQPELESIPRGAVKKDLSRFVLAASREPLSARANWLFASLSQDKAERAQAAWGVQKAAGREGKSAAVNVRNAWLNARSAWAKYLDRNNLGPSLFVTSLPDLRRHLQRGDAERALTQWEYLHRELHQYIAAKLELARAMSQTGQDPTTLLEQLAGELDQLLKNELLAKERAAAPASGLFAAVDGQRRWSLLMRDWGADGYLTWTLSAVRLTRK